MLIFGHYAISIFSCLSVQNQSYRFKANKTNAYPRLCLLNVVQLISFNAVFMLMSQFPQNPKLKRIHSIESIIKLNRSCLSNLYFEMKFTRKGTLAFHITRIKVWSLFPDTTKNVQGRYALEFCFPTTSVSCQLYIFCTSYQLFGFVQWQSIFTAWFADPSLATCSSVALN